MSRVLITGSNGYIGNALICALSQMKTHEFFQVDNLGRENWAKEVGGLSLTTYLNYNFFLGDLANPNETRRMLHYFHPDVIVHLASQPSGPYSEISLAHRDFTQTNNLRMLLNLLCVSKEFNLNPKFIVTTTTGVPGAPNEPILEAPTPNQAGSAYHVSRGFDSANLSLAAKQWGYRALEMRTSIVYGTRIDAVNQPCSRFDWDFYFGTALNRFCVQKKMNKPIKVYGKGLQRKPFISLRDCVASLIKAIDYDFLPGHKIVNQTTGCYSIVEVAKAVGGEIEHIQNPRIEKEDHEMVIHNSEFMKILNGFSNNLPASNDTAQLEKEIELILMDIDTSKLPTNWEDIFNGKNNKKGVLI